MKVIFIGGKTRFGLAPFISSQADSLRKAGLTVDEFIFDNKRKSFIISEFFRLRRYLRNNHYDIIHAHYAYFALYALLARKKSNLIISYMGTDLYGAYDEQNNLKLVGLFNIILSKLLLLFVDGIIVKSKGMLHLLPKFYQKKSIVLPNGVDFERYKPIEKSEVEKVLGFNCVTKKLLFLGDINDPRKNYNMLKKSLEYLDNGKCEIISPFPVESKLVPYYLNACDVLCFPSLREGSPNVIKEAMACNSPIVATDVGDIREVIKDTDGCFLSTNDPKDFAEKINQALLFNKTKGRESITHLSSQNIAHKLIKYYQDTISKRNST